MAGRVERAPDHEDGPMVERFWWLGGADGGADDAGCAGDGGCGGDGGWLDGDWNGHLVCCHGSDGGRRTRQEIGHDREYRRLKRI